MSSNVIAAGYNMGRWHSPRDCVESASDGKPVFTLSERMRSDDNLWHQLWKETASIPVSNQRQLFDCTAEVVVIVETSDFSHSPMSGRASFGVFRVHDAANADVAALPAIIGLCVSVLHLIFIMTRAKYTSLSV